MNISIEGIIGVGKTTIIKGLANRYKLKGKPIEVFEEPVNEWIDSGILKKFYDEPKKYAVEFQQIALESFQRTTDPTKLSLIERSPFSAYYIFTAIQLFKRNISIIEFDKLEKLLVKVINNSSKINAIIYIESESEIALERLRSRNRSPEKEIRKEYIDQLNIYHRNIFIELKSSFDVPVIIIKTREDVEDLISEIEIKIEELEKVEKTSQNNILSLRHVIESKYFNNNEFERRFGYWRI